MKIGRMVVFALGGACLIALLLYAGADAVLKALAALGIGGLLIVCGVHLPVTALLGTAWWTIARSLKGATPAKFVWARLVRDGAAESLPFSQLGGFVLGIRALHLSRVEALQAALAMSLDLVMELWAKLPYFMAGLVALVALSPGTPLVAAGLLAAALSAMAVAMPVLFRHRLLYMLKASARSLAARWPKLTNTDDTEPLLDRLFSDRRALFVAFGIHLACWLAGGAETWLIFRLMGTHIPLLEAMAIDSLVSGLRTFAFLVPAAAGIQEASYVAVGILFGVPAAASVAFSLARRARDLALGIPTLALWQWQEAAARPRTDYSL